MSLFISCLLFSVTFVVARYQFHLYDHVYDHCQKDRQTAQQYIYGTCENTQTMRMLGEEGILHCLKVRSRAMKNPTHCAMELYLKRLNPIREYEGTSLNIFSMLYWPFSGIFNTLTIGIVLGGALVVYFFRQPQPQMIYYEPPHRYAIKRKRNVRF